MSSTIQPVSPAFKNFVAVNIACDYIPGVSVVTNLVQLILKCIYHIIPHDKRPVSPFWTYLNNHVSTSTPLNLFFVFCPVISNIVLYSFCIKEREWKLFE